MTDAERSIVLPADLTSIRVGRHFARDVMLDWDLQELVDDVQLGTSELVTNAIQHAGTDVVLTVRRDTVVTILVEDRVPELHQPSSRQVEPTAEHGRGLQIVAAISSDWGVATSGEGKCIWFELVLPDMNSADADVFAIDRKQQRTRPSADPDSDGDSSDDSDDGDDDDQAVSGRLNAPSWVAS